MASGTKITIEADFGLKAVEKTDIFVYKDGKLIDSYFDTSYDNIRKTAEKMRTRYEDAEVEICCIGEDCAGGSHRWSMDPSAGAKEGEIT